MTYEQLTHFLAAAKHLNFTKAAESLYLHPSSISKSVAKLETEAGRELFVRSSRNMVLTTDGKRLLELGKNAESAFDAVQQEVYRMSSQSIGQLNMICCGFHVLLLSEAVTTFQALHPNIKINLVGTSSNDIHRITNDVRSGNADIGLTFSICIEPEESELESMRVAGDRLVLMTSRNSVFGEATKIPFEEMCRIPILINDNAKEIPEEKISSELMKLCGKTLKQPKDRRMLENGNQMLLRLMSGQEAAILPRSVAMQSQFLFNILDVDGGPLDIDIVLIWRKGTKNFGVPIFLKYFSQSNFVEDIIDIYNTKQQ